VTPRRLFDPRYRLITQDGIRHKPLAHFATQVPLALLIDKLRFTRAVKPRWGSLRTALFERLLGAIFLQL
jgi:hypothetical protein